MLRSVGAGGGQLPPATRWMWKRSHGGTIEAPPDERGGNRYVLPNATAPHLDTTKLVFTVGQPPPVYPITGHLHGWFTGSIEVACARAALARLVRHRQFGKAGIVGIDDVGQLLHFADTEPFQFGVFVADVGGVAALPGGNGVDVMQCISVNFRLPFLDRCDQSEPGWGNPDLFPGFPDECVLEALAILHVPADRIPMLRPDFFRRRTQAEKHLAIRADEQRADGS